MNIVKLALLISLSVALGACGKNSSPNTPSDSATSQPGAPTAKALSEMSLPELLSAKYDSAVVKCSLWTRMNGPLMIANTPDDSASIDLRADQMVPKVITLTGQSDQHSLEIQITLTDIQITNGGYSDNFGARYSYTNSPSVGLKYLNKSKTVYPDGWVGADGEGSSILSENIVATLFAQSSGPEGAQAPTVDYVACSVVTTAKPEYKDQWKQLSPGVQSSCLLGQPVPPAICMIQK
jgi:hypothetical protein